MSDERIGPCQECGEYGAPTCSTCNPRTYKNNRIKQRNERAERIRKAMSAAVEAPMSDEMIGREAAIAAIRLLMSPISGRLQDTDGHKILDMLRSLPLAEGRTVGLKGEREIAELIQRECIERIPDPMPDGLSLAQYIARTVIERGVVGVKK